MVYSDPTFSKSEKVTEKSSILYQHRVIALGHLGTFIDQDKKEQSNLDGNENKNTIAAQMEYRSPLLLCTRGNS